MPWETLSREPTRAIPDLGPSVLESLFEKLMIDDEWAVRDDRAFTWWPHRLAQQVRVSTPREAFGEPMVAVRITNDLVTDVQEDDAMVEGVIGLLNMHASVCAYVWDPDSREVRISTSAYIHEGNRSLERFFSAAVLISTIEAHAKALQIAEMLSGRPATSDHPTSGERPLADDLLGFAEDQIVPKGQGQSAFVGPAMENATSAPGINWGMANASAEGFTGELPFLGDMPATVKAALGAAGPVETSLVQLLTEPRHPAYGSGLLALLRLPITQPADEIHRLAHGLNRAEALELTGIPQFGAWCQDPSADTSLVFATFVPSALFDPGIVNTLLFYTALRNEWARDRLVAERS
jgi:hypothetical protein